MEINVKNINEFYEENINIFESSNVNFLIGSGISASILATLNDLEELVEYNNDVVKNQTAANKKTQIEALLYWRFFKESIYPLCLMRGEETDNHVYSISKLFKLLYEILEKKEDSNLEKQINLFTTNYDLFFENALEEKMIFYNDGFLGRFKPKFNMLNYNTSISSLSNLNFKKIPKTYFNLIKFHGSLNWKKISDEIIFDYNYLGKISKFHEDYKTLFQKEYKELKQLYDKEEFSKAELEEKYESIKKIFDSKKTNKYQNFIKEYKSNFSIVNPTKEKFSETLLSLSYHDMLRLFSTNLEREHVSLFVFGFSFSDEHILKITERSLINPELKIVIFAFDHNALESYKKIFSKINSSNNITIVYEEDKNISLDTLISMYDRFSKKLYMNNKRG